MVPAFGERLLQVKYLVALGGAAVLEGYVNPVIAILVDELLYLDCAFVYHLFDEVEERFVGGWSVLTCLDVGCTSVHVVRVGCSTNSLVKSWAAITA